MALPNYAKLSTGTPIVLSDATDYNPAAANSLGTRTDQIDLTSLAAGTARQSDKFDFGTEWDIQYSLSAAIEWASSPVDGESVDFYIAFSPDATAANANPGNVSGADSAYTGYSSDLDDSLAQLKYLGAMSAVANTSVQIQTQIVTFVPTARYATLVVVNSSDADNFASDAIEMSVSLTPIISSIVD
tara:strand:+ start:11 stop:571 length:561 start_codon:yes stop_codon:yes gene_type:complete